ncbi:hypothetical protein HK405_015242 [Cladochytrium tenue]|nr:hypothetical protein HK405_015242 [Cladochytrium tenue]
MQSANDSPGETPKARRRGSWWERRRLDDDESKEEPTSYLDEPFDWDCYEDSSQEEVASPEDEIANDHVDIAPPYIETDVSVRDWLLEDEKFLDELDKNKQLFGLMNVIENLEGADLDSLSFRHHERRDFTGPHLYVADSFGSFISGMASSLLASKAIYFNEVVDNINYCGGEGESDFPIFVKSSSKLFKAKAVVCTIPLGVLKIHSQTLFTPALPLENDSAIKRLGMGLIDKVVLEFPYAFWPRNLDAFWAFLPSDFKRGMDFDEGEDAPGLAGFINLSRVYRHLRRSSVPTNAGVFPPSIPSTRKFSNRSSVSGAYSLMNAGSSSLSPGVPSEPGPPVLIGYISQRHARRLEALEDGEVADLFMDVLRRCFRGVVVPELESIRVTRWEADPFSRGSITVCSQSLNPGQYSLAF